MKHVYDTDEIAHLWMHKAQSDARNQQGNFYFTGPTIYSYRSHFPIARHVEHKGRPAILFTTRGHSVTTSKHVREVRFAIGGHYVDPHPTFKWTADVPVFEVYNPDNSTERNLDDWRGRIKDAAESVVQAKIRQATKLKRWEQLKHLVDDGNSFAKFFGVKPSFKVPASMDELSADLEAQAKRDEAKRKRDEAKRVKEYARKREQERIEAIPRIAAWVSGFDYIDADGKGFNRTLAESEQNVFGEFSRIRLPHETAYLRIDTDDASQVETSQGARVPVSHALRAFRFVSALRAKGETWQRNGHTFRVGHFQIDSVDEHGNVKAGCHRVEWTEVQRFGAILESLPDTTDGSTDGTEVESHA